MKHRDVVIVGAGLAGSLAASTLARSPGVSVTLLELRGPAFDANNNNNNNNNRKHMPRDIGLLLNTRGVQALRSCNIDVTAAAEDARVALPLVGRIRMTPGGEDVVTEWPDVMFAVNRKELNRLLLHAALNNNNNNNVELVQDVRVDKVTADGCINDEYKAMRWLIGADGRNSAVRRHLFKRVSTSTPSGYSWKCIQFESTELSRHHITMFPSPGDDCFFHAMPSPAGATAYIGTLVMPSGYFSLDTANIEFFFRKQFSRALDVVTESAWMSQYRRNGASELSTVHCDRFVLGDRVALIGDAAHAVVPFAGQGMNTALEDAVVLGECDSLDDYQCERMAEMHAMQRISLDAFAAVSSARVSGYHSADVYKYVNFDCGSFTVAETMMNDGSARARAQRSMDKKW